MKIIALEAENLKRLTAVRIEPDGNLVQITGKNGQGKTSVLDAIWWALEGTSNIQTQPIRTGEERAVVRLDLGDLKVTRRFNAQEDGSYTTSITVENAEGARFSSPQKMLDALIGELAFDPLGFARSKPEAQVTALRGLVPDFDFDANARDIKEAFDDRTEINRDAKRHRATAEELRKSIPDDAPEEVEDVADLARELQAAQEFNSEQVTKRHKIGEARSAIARWRESLEIKKMEVAELEKSIAEREAFLSHSDAPEDDKDTDAIMARMDAAEAAQGVRRSIEQIATAEEEATIAESISGVLTKQIEELKQAAREAIAKAQLPIPGLDIADNMVTLDGVPFNQASDAQQLRASVAIAMAMNPKLKVIRIRDGSLLDEDAMKQLAQIADDADYQIWIERVDSSGNVGFVLEDGHLRNEAPSNAATKEAGPRRDAGTKNAAPPSFFDGDRK